ncbi:hypothetical protein QOT17_002717 [Balamuthia mandrillaris]
MVEFSLLFSSPLALLLHFFCCFQNHHHLSLPAAEHHPKILFPRHENAIVAKLGIWGRVIFVVAFVVVAFPFVTGYVVLALGSGFLYGIWQATLIMVVGANIGACLAFFACRKLLRGWTLRQVRKSAKLSAIFDALGENGLKIAFLIRFVPVPFGLQNMVLASSAAIPFWRFMLGTALGLLPEQVAGAYFGKTARKLSDIIDGKMELGTTQKVLLGVDAAMVVLLIVVIVYVGRRALKTLSTRQQNNGSRAPTLNSGDEELEGLLSSAKSEEDELLLGLSSSSDTEAEEAASQDSAVIGGGDPFSFDRFGNAPLVPELASGDGNIPDIL